MYVLIRMTEIMYLIYSYGNGVPSLRSGTPCKEGFYRIGFSDERLDGYTASTPRGADGQSARSTDQQVCTDEKSDADHGMQASRIAARIGGVVRRIACECR